MNHSALAFRPKATDKRPVYLISYTVESTSFPQAAIFVAHQTSAFPDSGDLYFMAPDPGNATRVCFQRQHKAIHEIQKLQMKDTLMQIGTTSSKEYPETWDDTLHKMVAEKFNQQAGTLSTSHGSTLHQWAEVAKMELMKAGLVELHSSAGDELHVYETPVKIKVTMKA
ncbi:uncharacterized protein N7515_004323 [Penicillium bovifimosum]|uniref:Uncharacterized protein n=1 Tax=Penicillium bovifimosum TaxID=126998 RepID=A0A9W9L2A8_9EURO|nr:uncharacterized protein N7515_004323 [Penicillium bovifimosum]KAJ5135045.1 hypothetical protein N7515_004323 [Penicillium bovifimosum]